MLVYEKKAADGRHLYGTLGNVPADTDAQLAYKDSNGVELSLVEKDIYRDASVGGTQFIKRDSDAKNVNVFIGDKCIIGKVEATVNAPKPEPVKVEAPKAKEPEVKAVKKEAKKVEAVEAEEKAEEK